MARIRDLLTSTTVLLLILRYGGVAAGFLTQLILARMLEPEDLGLYFAAMSLAMVSGTIATFGYPDIAPRFISRYQTRERLDLVKGFVRQAYRDILCFSLIISAFIVCGLLLWPDTSHSEKLIFLLIALWLPILTFLDFNSWIALSMRSFFLAYGPESFLAPLLFLSFISVFWLLDMDLDVLILVATFISISTILTIGHWYLLRPLLPKAEGSDNKPMDSRVISRWRRESALQIPVSIFTMLFADLAILVTALILPGSELAAFTIALKIAMLIGFAVQVTHQVIIPDLADAHAEREISKAGETMRAAAALPIFITVGGLVGSMLFGDKILAIFHPDFASAQSVLVILCGCQLLRALAGPVVQLLMISGAQKQNAWLCVASTVFLVSASLVLVPIFGINGAGFAILTTWLFWLATAAIVLWRLTGMRCDILALSGLAVGR